MKGAGRRRLENRAPERGHFSPTIIDDLHFQNILVTFFVGRMLNDQTTDSGMQTNDMDLLRQYGRERSEQAFRSLVERHINVVYTVALRHTDNSAMAEDVTQAVFTVLAEKACALPNGTLLAGWLYRAT